MLSTQAEPKTVALLFSVVLMEPDLGLAGAFIILYSISAVGASITSPSPPH